MQCFESQIELKAISIDIIKKKNEYWATLLTEDTGQYVEGFVARKMKWLV